MFNYRRILFFAPRFFGYPEIIAKRLGEKGASVDLFFDEPTNVLFKLNRIFRICNYDVRSYWKNVESHLNDHYDCIFIIKGNLLPKFFYETLKNKYPDSFFIQYHWDDIDIASSAGVKETFQYFDRILCYNVLDAEKYKMLFRPFFFCGDLEQSVAKNIDLFFIGSYSISRYNTVKSLFALNDLTGFRLKKHFYINPAVYIHDKLPLSDLGQFNYSKMSYPRMVQYIKQSRCSVDIPFEGQQGLTTRSFESIPFRTKIVTTNKNIRFYDFYSPENVQIIDSQNPIVDLDWLRAPFKSVDAELIMRYSLDSWISDVFRS